MSTLGDATKELGRDIGDWFRSVGDRVAERGEVPERPWLEALGIGLVFAVVIFLLDVFAQNEPVNASALSSLVAFVVLFAIRLGVHLWRRKRARGREGGDPV